MLFRKCLSIALLLAAAQGCTSVTGASGREIMGRVEGIYVEARPGVLVERSLANSTVNGPMWANVSLNVPDEGGRTFMTARVDDGLVAGRGDLVTVRVDPVQPTLAAGPAGRAVVAAVIDSGSRQAGGTPYRKASFVEDLR